MLDVLCYQLSRNPVPMAVLTKKPQGEVDEYAKPCCFKQHKQEPQSPPLKQPKVKDDRFKNEKPQCHHHHDDERSMPKEDQKNQGNPQINRFEKYEKKINTSYTPFTLIVHVLIICQHLRTLYVTPSASFSGMRLASFTQLVYVTTTCFHIATLLANIFKKTKLERAFVLYGTWVIWIGWAMCLWLIRPENGPDSLLFKALTTNVNDRYYGISNASIIRRDLEYLLAPMDVAPFLMHGKWSTTTLPIISFFLLLVIRRNHWGLITWEYLVLLDQSRTLKWYRTWCVAGAGAGWMLTWEAAKFWLRIPFSNYKTDLPTFPGLFNALWASILAGIFMVCWWSFWTFQYRGVVWKKEFKEGVVVWSSDGWMRVASIGC